MKNKLLFGLVALMISASCITAESPVQHAVMDAIKLENGNVDYVVFSQFMKEDSITVGQQLCRLETLYEIRARQEERFINKFTRQGKKTNAELHRKELATVNAISRELHSLADSLSANKDDVLYRVYKFSYRGRTTDGRPLFGDKYVAIAPSLTVLSFRQDGNFVPESGRWLPGYDEILRRNREGKGK